MQTFMRMLSAMAKLSWETITDTTFGSLFSWNVVLHHQTKPNQTKPNQSTAAWCFDPWTWNHYTVSKLQAPVTVMPCHMPKGTSTVPQQKPEKLHYFLHYTLILIQWIKISFATFIYNMRTHTRARARVRACVCVCIYIYIYISPRINMSYSYVLGHDSLNVLLIKRT